ncbi:MAG: 2-oxoacid:acceptor oxidoreductase subunit alpha [Deltaproteobacteria bacterium]
MTDESFNILIGGEAGQGLATIGHILSKILVRAGYSIVSSQTYESRIRGGHNTFAVRFSPGAVHAPTEAIDILVALNEETVSLHEESLSLQGVVVVNQSEREGNSPHIAVPMKDLADGRHINSVALGVVGAIVGLEEDLARGVLKDYLDGAAEEVVKSNVKSLREGYRWLSEQSRTLPRVPGPSDRERRLTLNGNEAIALGALAAGLKFYSFYPMSPSTSIAVALIHHAQAMNLVVEQAEDEIAALNMAIGAAFAGAPSMVATSGGGFALMNEAVSLAAAAEIPVVIVVAQRAGPATGLPTRTAQGDLEFVLHSGHGEFPRALLTPGTVEECFHLTRKAFEMAQAYHGPVFLLTDQFLADSYHDVPRFGLDDVPTVRTCAESEGEPGESGEAFLSYKVTENGVSPRLLPGLTSRCSAGYSSEQLVVGDSHEHSEDGQITEDLSVRKVMVEKRLRKTEVLKERIVPPQRGGDDNAEVLLVCWGSTKGAVAEAASVLSGNGRSAAWMHFPQVWPMNPAKIRKQLEAAKNVVCVEENATGQFARLLRRETGFHIEDRVLRYDGLPVTPECIVRELAENGKG